MFKGGRNSRSGKVLSGRVVGRNGIQKQTETGEEGAGGGSWGHGGWRGGGSGTSIKFENKSLKNVY